MLAVADRTLKANTQYNLKGLNKLVGWKTHSHDAVDKTYSVHCKNTGKLQKQRGELIFALLLTHSLTHYLYIRLTMKNLIGREHSINSQ